MNPNLAQKLETLPALPGVYFHKNSSGEIIYVGKAAVLKNRVRQYFRQDKRRDPKTAALVREIFDTDWTVVDTEMDALFLESEMIKRYMPKWNILLRDDKTVSYVKINMQDEIPYISFTRVPLDDGATYVGPFYGKHAIEAALRILRKIFPYYIKPYDGKRTLDSDLGLSPGIEDGKTTPEKYKANLRRLIRILNGGRASLEKELEKEMHAAAAEGNYELAAEFRNEIYGLKGLKKKIIFSDKEFLDISSDQALAELQRLLNLDHPPRRIEGYDISHHSGEDAVGSMVVFINGVAHRSSYRRFKIRQENTQDDLASMREVISRRLGHSEWELPELVLLDGSFAQINAVRDLLDAHHILYLGRDKSGDHSHNAPVVIVKPDGEHRRLPRDSHLARLIARIDEESHRFAITYHHLLQSKNLFD